jgi:DNA invertase Pin-like site-specific DNA recombinase
MEKSTMRVAAYARVSTNNHHQDPEVQLRDIRAFCQYKGWEIVETYIDKGVSGAKASRPALNRMMADAEAKKFDAVMVWKFDRFARSAQHMLKALELFNSHGIAFVSTTENIDTSTPMGKMVFTVLAAVAEMERSLTVERIHAGLRNARAKGRKPGVKRQDIDIAAVRERIAAGESVRGIAKTLGISTSLLALRLKGEGPRVHQELEGAKSAGTVE